MNFIKKNGLISIHRINIDDKCGKTFMTNRCGEIKILSQNGKTNNNIKLYICVFLNTGTIIQSQYSNIKNGCAYDPMCPLVYNIGYLGLEYDMIRKNDPKLYFSLKQRWSSMISRCYNKNNKRYYNYGGSGIRVSKRWHNFSNYFYDVQKLEGFDRANVISGKLELDKDKNQDIGNKKYSNKTCTWLSTYENNKLRGLEQKIKCTHPDGVIEIIESVQECLRKFNMYTWNLYRILNGKQKTYKGYKFEYC